jgi:hypothetical protein
MKYEYRFTYSGKKAVGKFIDCAVGNRGSIPGLISYFPFRCHLRSGSGTFLGSYPMTEGAGNVKLTIHLQLVDL